MRPNVLIRKLENFTPLGEEDRNALLQATAETRLVPARTDLIREGDAPDDVFLIVEGFACRYKINGEGERQIMAYLVPGDFCDLHVFILEAMDHSIGTLSECRVVTIPRATILSLLERPAIARAFWWATLVDEGTLREWLVNVGSREANQRVAHLFCEIHMRLASVGLVSDGRFTLPLTQAELGDTMGLSNVHVNRTLQELRASGMLTISRSAIEILDLPKLQAYADFNFNYLHLSKLQSAQP